KYPTGATPLAPNETAGLLLSHITTREELNHWEQMNIGEAEEWAFNRKHKDLLSQAFSGQRAAVSKIVSPVPCTCFFCHL
ncbi:MAG: hypothetical protein QNL11_00725, partial [Desulfobacterales bacterium]|nr:hypothetical protein [Desulfobacterales bacterium]